MNKLDAFGVLSIVMGIVLAAVFANKLTIESYASYGVPKLSELWKMKKDCEKPLTREEKCTILITFQPDKGVNQ